SESLGRLLREFVTRQLFQQLTEVMEGPDRLLRVELVAAHLWGVAVLRHVLQMEPLASASIDELVAHIGPTLDRFRQVKRSLALMTGAWNVTCTVGRDPTDGPLLL